MRRRGRRRPDGRWPRRRAALQRTRPRSWRTRTAKSRAQRTNVMRFDGRRSGIASFEEARHALGDGAHATVEEQVDRVLRVDQHDDSGPTARHEHRVRVEVERLALMMDGRDSVDRTDEPAHPVRGAGFRCRDGGPVELVHSRRVRARTPSGSGRCSTGRSGSGSCPRRRRSGSRPGRAHGCMEGRLLSAGRTSSGSRWRARAVRPPPRT